MFLRDRCTILVLISLTLAHLAATERREKLEKANGAKNLLKSNGSFVSASENDRLRRVHDNDILKLIAGSSKSIRPKTSSSDNRASKENRPWRESTRSLDRSNSRKRNSSRTKYETRKKPKSPNTLKNQPGNGNPRKKKIKPIRGCSAEKKRKNKGYACRNAGRRVKRLVNIPGVEIVQLWNATWIIPIPTWFWPGFWAIFG